MTVIVSTAWGGRISVAVDRRISRRIRHAVATVDDESNKLVVVMCRNAIFVVAYTGIAVSNRDWMDSTIASAFAHRKLSDAFIQPGASLLARPAHVLLNELRLNMNGAVNSDALAASGDLLLLVQGWQFGKKQLVSFSCKLRRGPRQANGYRYFEFCYEPLRKFFREHPDGLRGETLGDSGGVLDEALRELASTRGLTHDDVELHVSRAIAARALETDTVSASSVAVQLDPRVTEGQVKFTYYPQHDAEEGHPLLTPWVLTPFLISSPAVTTSAFSPVSDCGRYRIGGFSDGGKSLDVVSRLPAEFAMHSERAVVRFGTLERERPPRH